MKTIAITNLKGGTGKTATAANMAYILAQLHNHRVLVIDADAQRNATVTLVDEENLDGRGLSDYLTAPSPEMWRMHVLPSKYRGISVIPGDAGLWAPDLASTVAPTCLRDLRDAIEESDTYDTVIIDCPPGFPASAVNALIAADVVIIPTTLDGYAFSGAEELARQITLLRTAAPNVRVGGVLLTRQFKSHMASDRERQLRTEAPFPIYRSTITNSPKVPESAFACSPVAAYSPHSWATVDYKRFVLEFLEKEGQRNG